MFKIGDRVKCINNSGKSSNLKKGREYVIYNIKTCECGEVNLDVGVISPVDTLICTLCRHSEPVIDSVDWCNSKRFIKIQEKKEYISVSTTVEVEETILN